MKKIYILLFILAANLTALVGQNDFALSEQLFSRIAVNPAGTGNDEAVNIFSFNHFQYAGAEGYPFSTVLNVQTYFDDYDSGLGLSFSFDNSGIAYNQWQANLVYAYHLNLDSENLLSFGLSMGVIDKSFDPSQHVLVDDSERGDGFPVEFTNELHYDAAFGIEYSNKYVLVGASVTHIPGFFYDNTSLNSVPNYYGYVRGAIPCGKKVVLAPAAVYSYTGQFHLADVNITGFFGDYFWAGLGYRTEATTYLMLGAQWNWFRVGYSCDVNVGELNNIAWTSHEVMLSFRIPTKKDNSEWEDF